MSCGRPVPPPDAATSLAASPYAPPPQTWTNPRQAVAPPTAGTMTTAMPMQGQPMQNQTTQSQPVQGQPVQGQQYTRPAPAPTPTGPGPNGPIPNGPIPNGAPMPAGPPMQAAPPYRPVHPGPAHPGPAHHPGAYPGQTPRYQFRLSRLTIPDQVIAAGALVLFVALWLPWFHVSDDEGDTFSYNGINAHSYVAFALLTSVLLIVYLALRAGWDRMPVRMPIAHAPLLLVVGLIQFAVVFFGFVFTPDEFTRGVPAWIALIASICALLPIALPALQSASRQPPR